MPRFLRAAAFSDWLGDFYFFTHFLIFKMTPFLSARERPIWCKIQVITFPFLSLVKRQMIPLNNKITAKDHIIHV